MSAAAKETVGFKHKKNQDWFDENDKTITSLIEVKHHARLAIENNPSAENNTELSAGKCSMPERDSRGPKYLVTAEIRKPTKSY